MTREDELGEYVGRQFEWWLKVLGWHLDRASEALTRLELITGRRPDINGTQAYRFHGLAIKAATVRERVDKLSPKDGSLAPIMALALTLGSQRRNVTFGWFFPRAPGPAVPASTTQKGAKAREPVICVNRISGRGTGLATGPRDVNNASRWRSTWGQGRREPPVAPDPASPRPPANSSG